GGSIRGTGAPGVAGPGSAVRSHQGDRHDPVPSVVPGRRAAQCQDLPGKAGTLGREAAAHLSPGGQNSGNPKRQRVRGFGLECGGVRRFGFSALVGKGRRKGRETKAAETAALQTETRSAFRPPLPGDDLPEVVKIVSFQPRQVGAESLNEVIEPG